MKYKNQNLTLVFLSAVFLFVNGYPISNTEENLINKDEKRYPNGTVIGKYTYTDEQGNPIHVRYYADDASYGVELKSVKVVSESSGTEKLFKNAIRIPDHLFETSLDSFTGFRDPIDLNKDLRYDLKQSDKNKAKGDQKNNAEFEILLQNELKAPEKCGKEKVKVYFDKDKRKTRDVKTDFDSMNYCNRV